MSADAQLPVPTSRSGLTPQIERNSVLITFSFQCNLACSFCIVEEGMGRWTGMSLDWFRGFAADEEQTRGLERVILTGGEVTLDKRLPEYVAIARSIPSVEHVRIQTNGIRVGKGDTLDRFVEMGIDEYFVSLHGHDPATCDGITQKRGSFDAIMAGIAKIGAHPGATLITDTAICAQNVDHLADIVAAVAPHAPESMEFWNLWPQIDKQDTRGHFVRVTDAAPRVIEAIHACVDADILPVVRNFPRCLLRNYTQYHYDLLPPTIIDAEYWEDSPEFDCIYRGICEHGTRSAPGINPQYRREVPDKAQTHDCMGLSGPYVAKFGWEEQALKPFLVAGAEPYRQTASSDLRHLFRDRLPVSAADSSRQVAGGPSPVDAPLAAAEIAVGTQVGAFTVKRIKRESDRATLVLDTGGDEVRVWAYPESPERRPYARAAGVDLIYERDAEKLGRELHAALDDLARQLADAHTSTTPSS